MTNGDDKMMVSIKQTLYTKAMIIADVKRAKVVQLAAEGEQ